MKIFFSLGIIGYFVYNLHLLTIEDFPLFPSVLLASISGFAIGAMVTSVDLVMSNIEAPIQYDPLLGGQIFIISLLMLNFIGVLGFSLSLWSFNESLDTNKINMLDLFALSNFFISPILIYMLRIAKLDILPFNFIFFNTELAFISHFLSILFFANTSGYPLHAKLVSLSLINIKNETVLGGYSSEDEPDFNKLQGMAIIAVDSVVDQIFRTSSGSSQYIVNYGDALLIKKDRFLVVSLFRGKGKTIGKRVLNRILDEYIKKADSIDKAEFTEIVRNTVYPFTHKKSEINSENIYFSKHQIDN